MTVREEIFVIMMTFARETKNASIIMFASTRTCTRAPPRCMTPVATTFVVCNKNNLHTAQPEPHGAHQLMANSCVATIAGPRSPVLAAAASAGRSVGA